MNKEKIPIFFAADDNYVPFLSVAISSLIENSNSDYEYEIIVLSSSLKEENMQKLKIYENDWVKIKFEDVTHKIQHIMQDLKLRLRDYYSISIFYRLFIPSLYPQYKKAIYLDADVVLVDDISNLYKEDISGLLVGAVPDEVVNGHEVFRNYSEKMLDLEPIKYFNSGVLLMNLEEFRKEKIEEKFLHLLDKYNFDVICPDQDYLNFLCKGKVKYVNRGWDRMPNEDETFDDNELHLIHFNMFKKPWNYDNVLYEDIFWDNAKKCSCYNEITSLKGKYSKEDIEKDNIGYENLLEQSKRISSSDFTFKNLINEDYFKML